MIKIGMPTLIELDTLEDNIKLCKTLKLDFIEINMNFPQYQLEKLDAKSLIELQEKYDIFFSFHLAEDIDIGHLNNNIRKSYVKEIIDTIDLMKAVGSKILNMHMSPGIYVTLPDQKVYIYNKYKDEYLKNIKLFLEVISEINDLRGLEIYIENTGIYDINYIKEGLNILLANSSFKLTWDIGHDYSSGYKDKDFMMKNIEAVKHYHIHDARGKKNHLTLYDGEIDVDAFIKKASNSHSTLVFETKTVNSLRESVHRYRQR